MRGLLPRWIRMLACLIVFNGTAHAQNIFERMVMPGSLAANAIRRNPSPERLFGVKADLFIDMQINNIPTRE